MADLLTAAKAGRSVPVLFADDVGVPEVDGPYIRIRLYQSGGLVAVLTFTTDGFYSALNKVAAATMPAIVSDRLH